MINSKTRRTGNALETRGRHGDGDGGEDSERDANCVQHPPSSPWFIEKHLLFPVRSSLFLTPLRYRVNEWTIPDGLENAHEGLVRWNGLRSSDSSAPVLWVKFPLTYTYLADV